MSWLTLAFTILMTVGLGGAVTSADVGMAYPTWPNINARSLFDFFYGSLADEFGTGASLEHTHRQAGSVLGLLSIVLVGLAWRHGSKLRRLALLNLGLVVIQGLIGALRVLENTQTGAIVHALGAQVVIVVLVALAKTSSASWLHAERPHDRAAEPTESAHPVESAVGGGRSVRVRIRLRLWTKAGMALLFLNLLAAASLRHKAGAFSGHLVLALTATAAIYVAVFLVYRHFNHDPRLRRDARLTAHLLGAQLGLGLATWAFVFSSLGQDLHDEQTRFLVQTGLATVHLVLGVLVMAAAAALTLEAHRPPPRRAT